MLLTVNNGVKRVGLIGLLIRKSTQRKRNATDKPTVKNTPLIFVNIERLIGMATYKIGTA
jgi:hypothetical protein